MRWVRSDALPEEAEYRDTGCAVAPACLSCPLPECVYVSGESGLVRRARARAELVRELHAAGGRTVRQVAREAGVSVRTAHRLLARGRAG